jgi:phosphatidylglycerol---prolipoprotein diacylglyceryl transferase
VHPHFFQFGRLIVPTYGFLVALGTILSLLLCLRLARLLSLDSEKIWNVALLAAVIALAGRIVFNLLRVPEYSFRLGFVAVALAAAVYAAHLGLPLRRTADVVAPSLALWSAMAAIACLEAGCDYGTPTRLPWAVIFRSPGAAPSTPLAVPLHPVQLYAGLIQFLVFVLLLWLLHRPHADGEILGAWLFATGLSSSLLTMVRGDLLRANQGQELIAMQLMCVGMVVCGTLLWVRRPAMSDVTSDGA